jgi:hypothetical protein
MGLGPAAVQAGGRACRRGWNGGFEFSRHLGGYAPSLFARIAMGPSAFVSGQGGDQNLEVAVFSRGRLAQSLFDTHPPLDNQTTQHI